MNIDVLGIVEQYGNTATQLLAELFDVSDDTELDLEQSRCLRLRIATRGHQHRRDTRGGSAMAIAGDAGLRALGLQCALRQPPTGFRRIIEMLGRLHAQECGQFALMLAIDIQCLGGAILQRLPVGRKPRAQLLTQLIQLPGLAAVGSASQQLPYHGVGGERRSE